MDLKLLGEALARNWLLLGVVGVIAWKLGEKWLYQDRMHTVEEAKNALATAGWHK